MGSSKGVGRAITAPLLALNLLFYATTLGLSGWMINRLIDTGFIGGNAATFFLALTGIIAGMVGIASIVTGLHHVHLWSRPSAAAAQAASWIAYLLLILPFCLAWKEIRIGRRFWRYRVLESFYIMLTMTQLLYTLALYIGDDDHNHHHDERSVDDLRTATPAVEKPHHHHHYPQGHQVPTSTNPAAASAV